MDERRESSSVPSWIEVAHIARRTGTHHREQRLDRLEHAGDSAEGESRGTETDDLSILRGAEAPDDVYGVCRGRHVVESLVQAVEPLTEPCSFDRRSRGRHVNDYLPGARASRKSAPITTVIEIQNIVRFHV